MSDKIEAAEALEPELSPEDQTKALAPTHDDVLESDVMDNIINAAKKMEVFDKAYSTIMNIVIKRTFAGDWVSHSKSSDPQHLRSASLSGAGCDRVATILGISEKNWVEHPKEMSADGKYYTFRYEADFTWGGLTRHAYGECSTQNKFFGYANGKWKELTDVREDHVRKAAQRECQKDGIRRLLGLRKVPVKKLQELGFDPQLIHFVNFTSTKEALGQGVGTQNAGAPAASAPKPAPTPSTLIELIFTPQGVDNRLSAKGSPFCSYTDENDQELYVFAPIEHELNVKLGQAIVENKRVRVKFEANNKDGKAFRTIREVIEVLP